ncbi:phage tail tape measure protein [Chromobacterium violaceum]|uniref:Phage-related minor tail protein n=4 Tax=Chromobacterium violaceum TaxID=536 RepID=A0AAX2M5S4_CHRVL|nr:phage tail tape measure protein [Chromobacterium violaceum]STB71649.1 Phage-related minor tail protein [Chromobacterium violaceum]SUX31366.1 Phage-related minor tail protein [Chromobacterium violaceum]
MKNMELALVMRFRDMSSRGASQALQDLTAKTKEATAAGQQLGKASTGLSYTARVSQAGSAAMQQLATSTQQASASTEQLGQASRTLIATTRIPLAGAAAMQQLAQQTSVAERAVIGLSRESQRAAAARELLGVRAENAIQREIRQTEAAYKRLAATGTLSAREQARAYDAMRAKVAGLRQELSGVSQLQRGMTAGAKGLMAGVGGVMAGKAVLASPMRRVADYDMRLANMANTAFNDTEVNGRKLSKEEQLEARREGKKELQGYIIAAGKEGGTNDDNLAALDKLIARGIFSPQEAGKLLPMISKAAAAAGSTSEEMTGVVMAAVQNAKIPVEEIPKALGMALKAGQIGGFELKDMATWLPKMLAMGGLSGLRGTDGLASILAASQLAVTAAGGTDEAGNNVVNFLQKITSADTANDFKKINSKTFGEKKKGEKGIDLYGTLAQARKDGIDSVEAFTRLVRRVAEGDKEFTKLQGLAKKAGNDKDKSALYGSMADILQARGVGKTIQDRQAMLALLPMLFDPEAYKKMKTRILEGGEQDVDINQRFIKEQAGFKFQQGENLKEQGQYESIGKFNNAVGDVISKLVEYGSQYPGLTASLVGATTAVSALAAAAGAAALPMLLMGRGGQGGPSGPPLPSGGPAARSLPAAGLGLGLTAVSLANFNTDEELEELKNGEARMKKLRAQYSADVIKSARKRYQPWYQFGDGYAAENEQWVQRYLQDEAKPKTAPPVAQRNAPNPAAPIPQTTAAVPQLDMVQAAVNASARLDLAAQHIVQASLRPIPINVKVDVQNGNIVAAVNAVNSQTARRN